jgi:hypothetical protein
LIRNCDKFSDPVKKKARLEFFNAKKKSAKAVEAEKKRSEDAGLYKKIFKGGLWKMIISDESHVYRKYTV